MGTWGTGVFDNDDACDWIAGLCRDGTPHLVGWTLAKAASTPPSEWLEGWVVYSALAAAEVVAAALGAPSPELPPEVEEWVTRQSVVFGPDVVDLARIAVWRAKVGRELSE